MNALLRLARSLPLVIALALLAVAVYLIVSWLRSPDRAKVFLINLFGVINVTLTVFFCVGVAYAWLEGNAFVMDLSGGFAAVAAVALAITLIARWRFLAHRPGYRSAEPHHLWRLL